MHFLSKNKKFIFLVSDAVFIAASFLLAFVLRFDGTIPAQYFNGVILTIIWVSLVFTLFLFNSFGLYSFSWAYVSTSEMVSLFNACLIGFLLTMASLVIFRNTGVIESFPRSTIILGYFFIFIFCGAIRISKRIYLQAFKKNSGKFRTLIVGAGDAGEQILRNIINSKSRHYLPVGFIDDSPLKKGISIHGYRVLGTIDEMPKIIKDEEIEELIIALPSFGSGPIKKAAQLGRETGLKRIKIVPSLGELMSGEISLGALREIGIEDLLGREPVKIDTKSIEDFIKDKSVLITGAAGSIGSELSRQVAKFMPSVLVLLDQDETGIFNISEELKRKFPGLKIMPVITDICDYAKIRKVFCESKPDAVFHAAAYKHVPLMEGNPDEAVKNNIFGLKNVAEVSLECKAKKFVFISTDKAVNPSSVMGATKRFGEMLCQALNQKNSTKFVSVRFGNVLDSRGSVIPIFREKISKRQAIEVTHPEMKRYFMLIPEACLLVMQAAEMGSGGEVFVLNMGEPVKILDLAKEMIKLAGLEPDKDIPIVFSGTRPGEKLFEEILTTEEGTMATKNQNIFVAKLSHIDEAGLEKNLSEFKLFLENKDEEGIVSALRKAVPYYAAIDKQGLI